MAYTIFFIIVLIALMMDPMTLTRCLWDHSSVLEYIIGTFLLLYVASHNKRSSKSVKRIVYFTASILCIYSLSILLNGYIDSDSFGVYIQDLFALLYLIVIIKAFETHNCITFLNKWFKFVLTICVIVIVVSFIYNFVGLHAIFYRTKIMGYEVDEIPFVCLMHYVNNFGYVRPSWLFAEPSYLGFFLGLQFLLFLQYVAQNKRHKLLYISLYLLALLATNAMTGYVCTAVSFIYYLLTRNLKIPKLALLLLVPLAISLYSAYDSKDIMEDNDRIATSSLGTRQTRLIWGISKVESMSSRELLFGIGRNKITKEAELGVSNVYLQFLIESGAIFLILVMVLFLLLLKKTSYEFFFTVLAFNITEVALKPITLLVMVIIFFYYSQPNTVIKTCRL